MGVAGCECPKASSATRIGSVCCALWKIPTTSASADDATTCLNVLHLMRMAQLVKNVGACLSLVS